MKHIAGSLLVLALLSSSSAAPLQDIVNNGANAFREVVQEAAGVTGLEETHRFADEAAITEIFDAINTVTSSISATVEKFTGLDHAVSQLLLATGGVALSTPLLKLKKWTNPVLYAQIVGPITAMNLLGFGLVPVVGGLGALQSHAYHLGQGFLNRVLAQP